MRWRSVAAFAAVGYAVLSLTTVGLQAVVLSFRVVTPAELAADVAAHQPLWLLAQAVLAGQQVLLGPVAIGLLAVVDRRRPGVVLALTQIGAAAVMFALSAMVHGVFGAHLGGLGAADAGTRADTLRIAEVLHALGDTTYFAGTALTAIAMLLLWPALRASPVAPSGLAALGLAAAAAQIGEFGWFLVPVLGYLAPVGVLLQAGWFGWLGWCLWLRGVSSDSRDSPGQ